MRGGQLLILQLTRDRHSQPNPKKDQQQFIRNVAWVHLLIKINEALFFTALVFC